MEQQNSPIHINQLLKLPIQRFGKEGDPIVFYKKFTIFLKDSKNMKIRLNESIKIRIIKILPKFGIGEVVK